MEKTSVLGDVIEYMEFLQERVIMLEEHAANETMEKRNTEDEGGDSCNSGEQILPEIEARVCNKNVLLKIHCEKRKGLIVKIVGEVDELNLTVVNISVAPFGSFALDITITAEMEEGFSLSSKDIVTALCLALRSAA